ncbi:hypothetical protein ACNVED_02745 [Legionella sp. D16C41]|uniref:hypothetical protein n=1 Tax=Legionella sp. D16C41 TaxID=3402688 RepID=UPI003AF81757
MNYLKVFLQAYKDYFSQVERPGHSLGWFSSLRHSRSLYPHIKELFDNLRNFSNEETQDIVKKLDDILSKLELNNKEIIFSAKGVNKYLTIL